jgi:predicted amidophosphoribosyltransferase
MHLSWVEFGSLLTYSPRGMSEPEQQSRTAMRRLKNDEPSSNPPALMSDLISNTIRKRMTRLPFANFFEINPTLVPIPNSSLMQPGTLWVPQRLASALVQNGLGIAVEECLKRVLPLRKSATADNRPKADEHYASLGVQKMLSESKEFLLVDDIVTRGATILGAANKLIDTFPEAHIRAFAAMRTISPPDQFKAINEPCIGEITLRGGEAYRRP